MDDLKAKDQLTEKIKHCQETARNLKEEFESLLQQQKSTDTKGDSGHSVEQTPLVNDVNKQLMDIDLAIASIQQQLKLVLEKCLSTQSDLPTSADRPMIQCDDNQKQIAQVTINQLVKLSNDNNGQDEAKLNSIVQALFTGTLPDDFYLHLMSVMGIQDCLLSNRLVCSFWNDLVLERCSNQKSLKLFETFKCLMNYGEWLLNYGKTDDTSLILKYTGDDLLFEGLGIDHEQLVRSLDPKMKREASQVLTVLFPKIEELVLCASELDTRINIRHLLQFYAEQLTSLTMTYFGTIPGSNLRAFSFPKLKSLNTFHFSPQEEHLLSLLPQLESLTLPSTEMSLETLLRTGTCLRELNIEHIESVYTLPVAESSKRPPIATNLRKFTFCSFDNVLQLLEFISLNLISLECLKLFLCYPDNLHSLTTYLAPLHQLHSLALEAPVSFFLPDDNQLAQIKSLPSVRHLKLLLRNYDNFSMDRFSRSLFTAFPNVEQILIAFVGHENRNGLVDDATFAAFEAFASNHPNVVQLFRSKNMSKFTKLPNIVAPLLGHYRQVYEEYIEEEELFGIPICKLTTYLVTQEGDDGPNLKDVLRAADRLTPMTNLLRLLESKTFAFTTFEIVDTMIRQMVDCALKYGSSQVALFSVTSKCVLALLGCRLVDKIDPEIETPFLYHTYCNVPKFFEKLLKLVEHSMSHQLDDKGVLLQLCKRAVKILTTFDSVRENHPPRFHSYRLPGVSGDYGVFTILLKWAHYYQTQQLNVLENDETLLLQIHKLIDDQLKKLSKDHLDAVISHFIRADNRVYRVEMTRALARCCEGSENCFKLASSEEDSDGPFLSSESEPEL